MKSVTLLLLLMLTASSAFAQKKGKVDPRDAKIDSLMKATTTLNMKLDSTTKDLARYHGMYDVMSTKVFKYAFKPERTGAVIDSLRAQRTSTESGMKGVSAALADTVLTLRDQNAKLKAEQTAINDLAAQKAKAVADLKEFQGLLDQKQITQAEFAERKAKLLEKW